MAGLLACRLAGDHALHLTDIRLVSTTRSAKIISAELVAANAELGNMIWDARLYMLDDQIVGLLVLAGGSLQTEP
jgi:ABC-type nitrate/sulfonate/bicarbonate transport system permease component